MSLFEAISDFFLTDLEVVVESSEETPVTVLEIEAGSGFVAGERGGDRIRYVFYGGWLPTRARMTIRDAAGNRLILRRGRVGKVEVQVAPKDGRAFRRVHYLAVGDEVAICDLAGHPIVARRYRHRDFRCAP